MGQNFNAFVMVESNGDFVQKFMEQIILHLFSVQTTQIAIISTMECAHTQIMLNGEKKCLLTLELEALHSKDNHKILHSFESQWCSNNQSFQLEDYLNMSQAIHKIRGHRLQG